MYILLPNRVEVGVRLVHGHGLLPAHRKGLVMSTGELLAGAKFREHGPHIGNRTVHPFQLSVRETLPDKRRSNLVIGKYRTAVTLGRLVPFDLVVLDGGGLNLLGDALLHVTCRLPDLEEAFVRLVINGVRVDAWPYLWLRRKNIFDAGPIHRHLR